MPLPGQQESEQRERLAQDLAQFPEVVQGAPSLEQLQIGNIFDAQDYLGNWHLSICIDEKPNSC